MAVAYRLDRYSIIISVWGSVDLQQLILSSDWLLLEGSFELGDANDYCKVDPRWDTRP